MLDQEIRVLAAPYGVLNQNVIFFKKALALVLLKLDKILSDSSNLNDTPTINTNLPGWRFFCGYPTSPQNEQIICSVSDNLLIENFHKAIKIPRIRESFFNNNQRLYTLLQKADKKVLDKLFFDLVSTLKTLSDCHFLKVYLATVPLPDSTMRYSFKNYKLMTKDALPEVTNQFFSIMGELKYSSGSQTTTEKTPPIALKTDQILTPPIPKISHDNEPNNLNKPAPDENILIDLIAKFREFLHSGNESGAIKIWETAPEIRAICSGQKVRIISTQTAYGIKTSSILVILREIFPFTNLRILFFENNSALFRSLAQTDFEQKLELITNLTQLAQTQNDVNFLSNILSKLENKSKLLNALLNQQGLSRPITIMLEKHLLALHSGINQQDTGSRATKPIYIDLTEESLEAKDIPIVGSIRITSQTTESNPPNETHLDKTNESNAELPIDEPTNATTSSNESSPGTAIDHLIKELRDQFHQVIFKRLNSLVKKSKATQYQPFSKEVGKYFGQYALPLPKKDLIALMNLIDLYSKQVDSADTVAKDRFSQFVLKFFKSYRIYFYSHYDENGFYSDRNQTSFHFILDKDLLLQQRIIDQNEAMLTQSCIANACLRLPNSDLVTNTLLFTQVEYLSKDIINESETTIDLFVIINPPSGLGKNGRIYTADLVLVERNQEGFAAFYEISKLNPKSIHYKEAMKLVSHLNINLQTNLLNETGVRTHSFTTATELNKFLKIIETNNQDENCSVLTPLIGMAPIKKSTKKKKKAAVIDEASNKKHLKHSESGIRLATRKLFKEKLHKKAFKSTNDAFHSSSSIKEDISPRSFEDYLNSKLNSFKNGASRPLRFANKVQEDYAPTKEFVEYPISDTLEKTIQEIGFNYFSYQLDGIKQCSAKRRVLLADEMGLGKTIQAITLVKDRLKHMLPRKCALILVPKSVLKTWQTTLVNVGIPDHEIGILMGSEGLSTKVQFSHLRSKKVLLATLGTFQSRLNDTHDNAIKRICGYLPRIAKAISGKITYNEIDDLYKQITLDASFPKADFVGKEYISKDNKNVITYFFHRMPNLNEFRKLEGLVKSRHRLLDVISWEIIWHYLVKKGFINALGGMLVTKKSLHENLQKLYEKHQQFSNSHASLSLSIPIDKAVGFITERFNDFSVDNLVVDEAHRIAFPSQAYHRLESITARLQKNNSQILFLSGSPGKNRFTEVYSLHALLDNAYINSASFSRAFNRDKLGIQSKIWALITVNSQENREKFSSELNRMHERIMKVVERQKKGRIRRTVKETQEINKIPISNRTDEKYSMSERENRFLTKHKSKIKSICRNYGPAIKINKKTEENKVNSKKINLFTLQKFFSHPILKNSKYGPKLFSGNPEQFNLVIEEYRKIKCDGDLDKFIAQSSRLNAICELVSKHPNEKILIDVKFLPFAHIIQYVLQRKFNTKVGVFSGELGSAERDQFEEDFNENNAFPVACVTKAGGEGIKLYAEHVILEQNWCVANRRQFEARARRTGSPYKVVHVHDLFSTDNPLDMKYKSFSKHKKKNDKLLVQLQSDNSKRDLLNIIIDEMIKEILVPETREKIEEKREKLHEIANLPPQFNLLASLQQEAASNPKVRKWENFVSAHSDALSEEPDHKIQKGKEIDSYEENEVFEEELEHGCVIPMTGYNLRI